MTAPQITPEIEKLLDLRRRANWAYQQSEMAGQAAPALLAEIEYLTSQIDAIWWGVS